MNILEKINIYLVILLPFLLITGPFLSDLSISLIGIIAIYLIFNKKNYIFYQNKFFILFIIFCIYIFLNSLFSDYIFLSMQSSLFYFRFGFFCIGVLYIIHYHYNFFYEKFFKILLLIFIIVCIDGYIQAIFGYNSLGMKLPQPLRLSGFFGSEQILGSYLVRLLPLATIGFIFFFYEKKNFNLNILIFLIFSFLIIVLTGERASSILAFIYLAFFLYYSNFFSKKKKIIFSIICISLVMVMFTFVPRMNERLLQTKNQIYLYIDEYGVDRQGTKINFFTYDTDAHFRTAYAMFVDKKLFGHGPKTFRKHCSNPKYNYNRYSCTTHPHNTYLQLLAETGLIGFSFVFIIFIMILKKIFYFNKIQKLMSKKNSNINLCLLLALIINLFPFLPTGNFFNNWLSIIYYLPVSFILYEQLNLNKLN